ncbi:MAG: hypothetical protein LBR98_06930 [Syntrophomonadaceae bacterium]|jgi:hypothetical protein|nr:hypothetical protein [Syntrophomonadaceae bacterium]
MNIFKITDKSGYSVSWILLTVIFILVVLFWKFGSPVIALLLSLGGALTAAASWRQGKKRIGEQIELTEQGIVFTKGDDIRCISYEEIKSVKEENSFARKPCFTIKTYQSSVKLQPDFYENGKELREKLLSAFKKFNCRFE